MIPAPTSESFSFNSFNMRDVASSSSSLPALTARTQDYGVYGSPPHCSGGDVSPGMHKREEEGSPSCLIVQGIIAACLSPRNLDPRGSDQSPRACMCDRDIVSSYTSCQGCWNKDPNGALQKRHDHDGISSPERALFVLRTLCDRTVPHIEGGSHGDEDVTRAIEIEEKDGSESANEPNSQSKDEDSDTATSPQDKDFDMEEVWSNFLFPFSTTKRPLKFPKEEFPGDEEGKTHEEEKNPEEDDGPEKGGKDDEEQDEEFEDDKQFEGFTQTFTHATTTATLTFDEIKDTDITPIATGYNGKASTTTKHESGANSSFKKFALLVAGLCLALAA